MVNNAKLSDVNKKIKEITQDIDDILHKVKLKESGVLEELELVLINSKCNKENVRKKGIENYFGDFYDILPYALRNISLDRKKELYERAECLVNELGIDKEKLKKLQERYYIKKNPRDYFLIMDLCFVIHAQLRSDGYSHKELTSKNFP